MALLTEKLLTLDMLVETLPALKVRTVRYWLVCNPGRFRERCVVKIGRKLYYDLEAVERWLLDHKGAGASTVLKS